MSITEKFLNTKLYIHIGTHKTGTTALQHAMQNASPALSQEGIIYLPSRDLSKRININRKLTGQKNNVRELHRGRHHFRKSIESYGKDADKTSCFVLSRESLSGSPFGGYTDAENAAKNLKFITAGYNVNIIVYLRRQDCLIESLYVQKVKKGQSCTFGEFAASFDENTFNWYLFMGAWARYFGKTNIIVKKYDNALSLSPREIFDDFGEIIGLRNLWDYRTTRDGFVNKRYSAPVLQFAKFSNPWVNKRGKKIIRNMLERIQAKPHQGSYFSPKERKEIINRYKKSNALVAKEYFNDPKGILFSQRK